LKKRTDKAVLDFFRDIAAFETPGADLNGEGGALDFRLDLMQIWFPGAAGTVFGVAHLVAGNGVFSTNIAGAGHNRPSFRRNYLIGMSV
jgi:hypothetical protein